MVALNRSLLRWRSLTKDPWPGKWRRVETDRRRVEPPCGRGVQAVSVSRVYCSKCRLLLAFLEYNTVAGCVRHRNA